MLVIAFVFAWFFYGIGGSIEANNAPANNTTMAGGFATQVGLMGTVGQILPVLLLGFGGFVILKIFTSSGDL
jgi:hypothetical protein